MNFTSSRTPAPACAKPLHCQAPRYNYKALCYNKALIGARLASNSTTRYGTLLLLSHNFSLSHFHQHQHQINRLQLRLARHQHQINRLQPRLARHQHQINRLQRRRLPLQARSQRDSTFVSSFYIDLSKHKANFAYLFVLLHVYNVSTPLEALA
jgi:septal ring factor EnvC (AmiA/AmiB activator)